jgi:DNA-binding winged helix-turn-helix (wHTH) protein
MRLKWAKVLGEVLKMIGRSSQVSTFGEFRFVPGDGLWRAGTPVTLPPRALGVLTALLTKPGVVVSKQELMDAVWPDTFVTESSLLEAIGLLRDALGDNPRRPTYIQTVHRRGYRFIGVAAAARAKADATAEFPPFFSGPEWRPIVAACVTYAVTTVCVAIVLALFGQPRVERRLELAAPAEFAIPSWSTSGLEIAFAFSKAGPFILTGTGHRLPTSLSRDGNLLIFTEFNPVTGADVWLFDRRTGHRRALVRTMADETWARLSPDGRQIAYMSNGSGRWEVYRRSTSASGDAARVSHEGGAWPSWSNDGTLSYSRRIHGRPELRIVLDWFSELATPMATHARPPRVGPDAS